MRSAEIRNVISRWRAARRVTLGAIVLAGSVLTSTAVMYKFADQGCRGQHAANRAYTYSGVGVVIEREKGQVVVRRILPGSPAQDMLHPGARLVAVNGEQPGSLEAWASKIRGAPGTAVELEVAGPCGRHKVVTLTRDVIRLEY